MGEVAEGDNAGVERNAYPASGTTGSGWVSSSRSAARRLGDEVAVVCRATPAVNELPQPGHLTGRPSAAFGTEPLLWHLGQAIARAMAIPPYSSKTRRTPCLAARRYAQVRGRPIFLSRRRVFCNRLTRGGGPRPVWRGLDPPYSSRGGYLQGGSSAASPTKPATASAPRRRRRASRRWDRSGLIRPRLGKSRAL